MTQEEIIQKLKIKKFLAHIYKHVDYVELGRSFETDNFVMIAVSYYFVDGNIRVGFLDDEKTPNYIVINLYDDSNCYMFSLGVKDDESNLINLLENDKRLDYILKET